MRKRSGRKLTPIIPGKPPVNTDGGGSMWAMARAAEIVKEPLADQHLQDNMRFGPVRARTEPGEIPAAGFTSPRSPDTNPTHSITSRAANSEPPPEPRHRPRASARALSQPANHPLAIPMTWIASAIVFIFTINAFALKFAPTLLGVPHYALPAPYKLNPPSWPDHRDAPPIKPLFLQTIRPFLAPPPLKAADVASPAVPKTRTSGPTVVSTPAPKAPVVLTSVARAPTQVPIPKPQIPPKRASLEGANVSAPQIPPVAPSKLSAPAELSSRSILASGTASSEDPSAAASPQGHSVQIGAYASSSLADKGLADTARRMGDAMQNKGKHLQTISTEGHTLYRALLFGFDTPQAAHLFCAALKAKGGACIVRS